jgi:hypothetical protein
MTSGNKQGHMPHAYALFECSGCGIQVEAKKRSPEYRDKLCRPCLVEWNDLDARATAFLKHLRAIGEHLE